MSCLQGKKKCNEQKGFCERMRSGTRVVVHRKQSNARGTITIRVNMIPITFQLTRRYGKYEVLCEMMLPSYTEIAQHLCRNYPKIRVCKLQGNRPTLCVTFTLLVLKYHTGVASKFRRTTAWLSASFRCWKRKVVPQILKFAILG